MNTARLTIAAVAVVAFAVTHAVLGELRFVRPLAHSRCGLMADDLMRRVLRLAWHYTTGFILLSAAFLFFAAKHPTTVDVRLVSALGLFYLGAGVVDCVVTRGRHDAWPPLVLVGLIILSA